MPSPAATAIAPVRPAGALSRARALGHLLAHVGDVEVRHLASPLEERHRRLGLVGVDMDLERRLVADDEDRVAQLLQPREELARGEAAAGDDEVGAVAEAAVLVVGTAEPRAPRSGTPPAAPSSPRSAATTPARISTRPCPPASTTPDSRSTSSCSGVRATARSPSAIARSSTSASIASCSASPTSRPSRCLSASRWASWRVDRVRHLAENGQHRALGRLAHRLVGGVGGAGEGGGDEDRVDQLAGAAGQLLGGAADDLAEDHAGVAAGAHQRRPGQRLHQLRAADLVDLEAVEAVELLHHGAHRHRHVVAGVAVGDREDVEVVDLLASRLQEA